jgi:hypothetical protein
LRRQKRHIANNFSTINFCADSLPKLKDFPAAIGGCGEALPE